MSVPSITREEFQAAVEAGVRSGLDRGVLTFGQAATLRAFAAEHTGLVVFGNFYRDDRQCGCPLTETGLDRRMPNNRRRHFYSPYDDKVYQFIQSQLDRMREQFEWIDDELVEVVETI